MSFEYSKERRSQKQAILNELEDIHTHFIGIIIEVDNKTRRCTVKLLQTVIKSLVSEAIQNPPPILRNIPLPSIFENKQWIINSSYAVGDKVEILISERPLEEALRQSEIGEQQSFRRMEIEFAIVLRAISDNIYEEDNIDPQNMVLMNKQTGDYIKILKDGGIEINGDVKINGNLNVTGQSKAEDHLSGTISGKGHQHSGVTVGSDKTSVPE